VREREKGSAAEMEGRGSVGVEGGVGAVGHVGGEWERVAGSAVCGDWGEAAEGVAGLGVMLGFRGRTCVYIQSTHIGPIWVVVGASFTEAGFNT
jgi:hypothetical protein